MSDFEGQVVEGQEGQVVEGQEGAQGGTPPSPLEPGGVRFEQVYGKMKDYENRVNQWKELGDPNQVREQLTKLRAYEDALKQYRENAARTPQEQQEAQRAQQLRRELERVYPEIKDVTSLKELRDAIMEMRQASVESQAAITLDKASQRFTDTLKAAKIDTKYQTKIEEYLVSQMSQEERQAFVNGQYEIAERIFQNELKDGLFAGMRAKPTLPTPALRHTPGGTPPAAKGKGPKTLEEAADMGFGMISNRE